MKIRNILFTIIVLCFFGCNEKPKETKNLIQQGVEEIAMNFPQTIEEGLVVVKCSYINNEIVYSCTVDEDIYDMKILEANKDEMKKEMKMYLLGQEPDLKQLRYLVDRYQTNIVYLYKGTLTGKVVSIKIYPNEL